MNNFWVGAACAGIGIVVFAVAAAFGVCSLWYALEWICWKRRQLKLRAEWTADNPYWQEAFDAGVKWADDGKPRAKPWLTRSHMPEGESQW